MRCVSSAISITVLTALRRISWPNSQYVFDLGDKAASTKVRLPFSSSFWPLPDHLYPQIQLRPLVSGGLSQIWRLDGKPCSFCCSRLRAQTFLLERGIAPSVCDAIVPSTCCVKAFTPGAYFVLLNSRSKTVMDLSGADSTSIIGYPKHGLANQQWEFIPNGHGYIIRSMRPSADGHALYLALDCGGLRDYAPVVASPHPVSWSVQQTDEGIMCVEFPLGRFRCGTRS